MIGETIAHYKITEKIGAGGMGEVFLARDSKLNRDVALKILPEIYTSDTQRMGRFRREAQLLASLNHANIAAIYGVEESHGTMALVLELVQGEDLSEKLGARTLAVEEALEIAVQIAEALETAHEKGVIHRDLKPANVKVTPDGKVKVLDFGLAKALAGDAADDSSALSQSMSPTMTAAATSAGLILGTAAYMSPEQARGKTVDRRADIWAFGTVLFEMLTRKQLFAGETVSDTLAAVIKDEPDWNLIPADTPQLVVDLMRRCLEKDPRRRLQSIGEARIALDNLLRAQGEGASVLTMVSSPSAMHSGMVEPEDIPMSASARLTGRRRMLWITSLVVVAVLAVLAGEVLRPEPPVARARKFHITPDGLQVNYPTQPALSPDGTHVAYFADNALHIRDLDRLEAVEVPGTDAATSPFWSPDGSWLAFGQRGRILKVPAAGGAPVAVCDVPFAVLDGAAWGEDGVMILAPNAGAMYRVSSRGGDPQILFPVEPGESDFHTPSILPGGRGILFTTHNTAGRETIEVLAHGERTVILRIPDARLEYVAWIAPYESGASGHLIYHRMNANNGVWAVPFDLDALEVSGEPFILDPDGSFPSAGHDGALLHVVGSGGGLAQLVVVDRAGEVVSTIGQPQTGMTFPELSPDGRWVLVSAREGEGRAIWVHDIERGTRTRITFDTDRAIWHGTWMNEGTQIAFSSGSGQSNSIRVRRADGSDEPTDFTNGYNLSSPDGVEVMAFARFSAGTGDDIYFRQVDGSEEAQPFLETKATENAPAVSPDGKYIAYMSNESGRLEVYLKNFPSGDGKWQVSTAGGTWPMWSRAGDEIYYRQGAGSSASMMAVRIETTPVVRLGNPEALFSAADFPNLVFGAGYRGCGIMADPDHFLMVEREIGDRSNDVRMVYSENWYESYRRGVR